MKLTLQKKIRHTGRNKKTFLILTDPMKVGIDLTKKGAEKKIEWRVMAAEESADEHVSGNTELEKKDKSSSGRLL